MPIYLDLKKIPEVAILLIDHRLRIERRSLFLAATDWQTISPVVVMGLLLLAKGEFLDGLPEGLDWFIAGAVGVGGVGIFLLVFFIRANHHAARIGRLATSLVPQGDLTGRPEPAPPAPKAQGLPGWRKAASLVGLGASLPFFYLGAVTPNWLMVGVGTIAVVAGGLLGTSWKSCRACQNVNVGLWSRADRCASCGTSFREDANR